MRNDLCRLWHSVKAIGNENADLVNTWVYRRGVLCDHFLWLIAHYVGVVSVEMALSLLINTTVMWLTGVASMTVAGVVTLYCLLRTAKSMVDVEETLVRLDVIRRDCERLREQVDEALKPYCDKIAHN